MNSFKILAILLVSTGVYVCSALNANAGSLEAELEAWKNAQLLSNEQCGEYNKDNPLPRNKAMEVFKCWKSIVEAQVKPNAVDPAALNAYLDNYQDNSSDYQSGEISRDEANRNSKIDWDAYFKTIASKTH